MKKFFANTITLIAAIICFVLCVLWFISDNGKYEVAIAGIGFMVPIIVSVFFRTKKDESKNNIELKNSDNNIIIQDNNGKISITK